MFHSPARPSAGLLFGICTYLIVLGIFDEVHRMSALIALLTLLVYAGVLLRAFTAKVCLSVRRRSIRSEAQKQTSSHYAKSCDSPKNAGRILLKRSYCQIQENAENSD